MNDTKRVSMRGFSLIEAMVCVALLAGTMLALTTALLGSVHAEAKAAARETLAEVASDVVTDLRVATAYQPEVLAALAANPPGPFSIQRSGPDGSATTIAVTETFIPATGTAGYYATVTATGTDGRAESVHTLLVQQAPSPGSIVTAPPTDDASSAGSIGSAGGAGLPSGTLTAQPAPVVAPSALASGTPRSVCDPAIAACEHRVGPK